MLVTSNSVLTHYSRDGPGSDVSSKIRPDLYKQRRRHVVTSRRHPHQKPRRNRANYVTPINQRQRKTTQTYWISKKRLSALGQKQDSIREHQACLAKGLDSIEDQQKVIRRQQASIAQHQDRLSRDFAKLREEQNILERQHEEIRLEHEELKSGFAHLRNEACRRRRSQEDLKKRILAVAEHQAHTRQVLENNIKILIGRRRALDILNQFVDEEEDPVVDEHHSSSATEN